MKKSIAILLSVIMLLSCVSVITAGAADTNATLNLAGKSYTFAKGSVINYTVKLKTENPIVNGQFYLNYPESILKVKNVSFPVVGDSTMFCNYTEDSENLVSFNFSNIKTVDFTKNAVLATIHFAVKAAGSGDISLETAAMSSLNDQLILNSEIDKATFTHSLAQTTLTAKAAKSSIAFGASTTVSATAKNGFGKTTYTSSNKKIATVDSKGKVVAKGVGTAKITVAYSGLKKTVAIKVVKAANPMKVTAKKTVTANSKKNTTFKGVVTIKKAQGKVTYSTNNKKVTVKSGTLVVKKGLKKGSTVTVKITVNAKGNANYKAGKKVVSVKIKVK